MVELPKPGTAIPVGQIHVSACNMRHGEPFGEDEDDRVLMRQVRNGEVVQMFIVRPEEDGFGVTVGSRRFQAKKKLGTKKFIVGQDLIVKNQTDEEARHASLIENFKHLKKDVNPIQRAKAVRDAVASATSMRALAAKWQVPITNISEWMRPLELQPKLQECVAKGLMTFTDAVKLVRMKLGSFLQEELAEILTTKGYEKIAETVFLEAVQKILLLS